MLNAFRVLLEAMSAQDISPLPKSNRTAHVVPSAATETGAAAISMNDTNNKLAIAPLNFKLHST
jgi:hypothetical protein